MATLYHIPVCPYCQRLEILLELKEMPEAVEFEVVDVTKPRPPELLEKTGGTTALPVLETDDGSILKESLVLLEYLDTVLGAPISREDPYEHAVEEMLIAKEDPFVQQGYRLLMNQDRERRDPLHEGLLEKYADLDRFLRRYGGEPPWLFDSFGYAEAVFTPFFARFWFLEYYEDFELPDRPKFDRVRAWKEALLEHPAAQQVGREQVVKMYYDYAQGAANGALVEGREYSTFRPEPHWSERPWPPRDKYDRSATDDELGLF